MKLKKGLIVAFVALGMGVNAQEVLFSVGELNVTADEFISVYEKNKGVGAALDPKTPEEYLDLYINFKLKIAEAYNQRRDTIAKFKSEFGGYRAQLAKPYLSDQGAEEALLQEAYTRLQEEVRASHIMIALESNALPEDTLKAYNELLNLRASITKGKTTFEQVARTQSADTWSAKQGGDLGYFTAFSMVYPFESAAYDLEVGAISMPVRSQYGYHLIKLTDRRAASGSVRVRHIFFSANGKSDVAQEQRAERSANEIYARLQKGEDFLSLVEFSEDKNTNTKGGELPEFGINKMMPAFEEAAFALQEPGDFSAPVRTTIGWHVIQLIERKPIEDLESLRKELERKIKRDSRNSVGAKRFLTKLKNEYNYTVNEKNYDLALKLVDFDALEAKNWESPRVVRDRTIITFADQEIKTSDVLSFWQSNQGSNPGMKAKEFLRMQLNVMGNDRVMAYEDGLLESKYPEFRNLVREYKEGILLFDLTQDEVWDKAAKDSTGIANEYEVIKSKYQWEDRITYSLWVCSDEKNAKKIQKWLIKGKREKVDELLTTEEALSIAYSSGLAQQKDAEELMQIWGTEKGIYGPVEMSRGGFAVLEVEQFHPAGPKALKEIKGLVIASYQDKLEKTWIESLKNTFEVKVNEEVKSKVFSELN